MLPFSQRARLHTAVASHLERQAERARRLAPPGAAAPDGRRGGAPTYEATTALAQLGAHWHAAGQLGRALRCSHRASREAALLGETGWARCSRDAAEMPPRCRRGAAEAQPCLARRAWCLRRGLSAGRGGVHNTSLRRVPQARQLLELALSVAEACPPTPQPARPGPTP